MKNTCLPLASLCLFLISTGQTKAAIVFSELNFISNTITLHNTAGASVGLDGWRLCSHDINQSFIYSATSALNGMTVNGNSTLQIDLSSLSFVSPFDSSNTLSVGLYNSSSFSDPNALEAFIQYTPTGNTSFGNAETRTSTAISAGLWDAAGSFVQVDQTDSRIIINDVNSAVGAASFDAVPEPSSTAMLGLALASFTLRRRR